MNKNTFLSVVANVTLFVIQQSVLLINKNSTSY